CAAVLWRAPRASPAPSPPPTRGGGMDESLPQCVHPVARKRGARASGRVWRWTPACAGMTVLSVSWPTNPCLTQLADRHRGIRHAVGEAPLVVVPAEHPHELAVDHLGLLQVEGGAGGIVVEVR